MIQFSSGANQLFSKLDTDRNGVSFKELQKLVETADGKGAAGIADGTLTADEVEAALNIKVSEDDLKVLNATLNEMRSMQKSADFDPSMVVFQRLGPAAPPDPAAATPVTQDEMAEFLDSGLITEGTTGTVSRDQIQRMISDIQDNLVNMGYQRAQRTGTMDNTTRDLIRDLQNDYNLPVTGRWNNKVRQAAQDVRSYNTPASERHLPTGTQISHAAERITSTGARGQRLGDIAEGVAGSMGTKGYCFRGVKQAIRSATGVYLEGASAYMAANQLARSPQFREGAVPRTQPALGQFLQGLPEGAVVVWPKTGRSEHGHISISLGDGREASDHIQSQIPNLRNENTVPRVFYPVEATAQPAPASGQ